ncbi:MAG: CDP-alcohol phosphatidyltransferase family protein [Lachnospiraceae bacterium]|nr:CDP-alcohol phosphatidyltransferase family protein [Lachnospiraceae bacterium]
MHSDKEAKNRIITIPNLLSAFRLVLIPVFIWTYCVRKEYLTTAGLLFLSGLTDLADGYIARRFHMVSNLGKMLDPVADKLTQAAMLVCLVTRFPMIVFPLALLAVKEASVGLTSILVIRKSGKVTGAVWHGKVTTALLYLTILVHLLWPHIPAAVSNGLIMLCVVVMLVSWLSGNAATLFGNSCALSGRVR